MMRTAAEIQAQYDVLMEKIESYEGNDAGFLAYLVGAAYALKWVLGEEDGSEFEGLNAILATAGQGDTTAPTRP